MPQHQKVIFQWLREKVKIGR